MDKPTLADMLGTKLYKSKRDAESAVRSMLKNGAAVGKLGDDTRIIYLASQKKWIVEAIPTDLPPQGDEPDNLDEQSAAGVETQGGDAPAFGALVQGGNANPPEVRKRSARNQRKRNRVADRIASVPDRLARVKAEAAGEVVPSAARKGAPRITLPEMAAGIEGPFELTIDEWPRTSDPRHWALEYSRKLRVPVTVRSETTHEVAVVIDHRTLRPPRKGTPQIGGTPTGFAAEAIALASRPTGVLRSELRDKAGRRNWNGYLKRLGLRFGYTLSVDHSGSEPRYTLHKQDNAEPATTD
jgi:hypothetical protein